jgi:putative heme iron utilization protein
VTKLQEQMLNAVPQEKFEIVSLNVLQWGMVINHICYTIVTLTTKVWEVQPDAL